MAEANLVGAEYTVEQSIRLRIGNNSLESLLARSHLRAVDSLSQDLAEKDVVQSFVEADRPYRESISAPIEGTLHTIIFPSIGMKHAAEVLTLAGKRLANLRQTLHVMEKMATGEFRFEGPNGAPYLYIQGTRVNLAPGSYDGYKIPHICVDRSFISWMGGHGYSKYSTLNRFLIWED